MDRRGTQQRGSFHRPGDVLFSEPGRECGTCGWQTFWANQGNYADACCEQCGSDVPALPAPLVDNIIRYENGEMPDEQVIPFFQELVDSRVILHLQGSYQRIAAALIDAGLVTVNTVIKRS